MAFAFKCGPPEGHHTKRLLEEFPDWRLSSGHAHPDANSFIIFARGKYLTGDTGYAGVPLTQHHNTLLINGKGQAREGDGHDAFADVPYERLDRIRIVTVKVERRSVLLRGDATAAYEPSTGVKKFVRELEYKPGDGFYVRDEIETTKPAIITSLIHADERVEARSNNQFLINASGVKLLIEALAPKDVRAAIEPNILTAPGPPGSVDKGERQERGQKLLLSTSQPAISARFLIRLSIIR